MPAKTDLPPHQIWHYSYISARASHQDRWTVSLKNNLPPLRNLRCNTNSFRPDTLVAAKIPGCQKIIYPFEIVYIFCIPVSHLFAVIHRPGINNNDISLRSEPSDGLETFFQIVSLIFCDNTKCHIASNIAILYHYRLACFFVKPHHAALIAIISITYCYGSVQFGRVIINSPTLIPVSIHKVFVALPKLRP